MLNLLAKHSVANFADVFFLCAFEALDNSFLWNTGNITSPTHEPRPYLQTISWSTSSLVLLLPSKQQIAGSGDLSPK